MEGTPQPFHVWTHGKLLQEYEKLLGEVRRLQQEDAALRTRLVPLEAEVMVSREMADTANFDWAHAAAGHVARALTEKIFNAGCTVVEKYKEPRLPPIDEILEPEKAELDYDWKIKGRLMLLRPEGRRFI